MAPKNPSLNRGIVRIIALVLAGLGLSQAALLGLAVGRRFGALEDAASEGDLRRVNASLDVEREALSGLAREYAAWDDALAFVAGENPGFPLEAFPSVWMENAGLDYIVVTNLDRRVLWAAERLPLAREGLPDGELREKQSSGGEGWLLASLADLATEGTTSMVVRLGERIVLAGAYPVTSSDFSVPAAGWVIFGRVLDFERVAAIARRAGLDARLLDAGQASQLLLEGRPVGDAEGAAAMLDREGQRLLIVSVRSPWGGLVGGIEFSRPRTLVQPLLAFLAAMLAMLLLSAVIAALILSGLLRRLVVEPLGRITAHLEACERMGGAAAALELGKHGGRGDEIGMVADHVDHLLGALDRRRSDLEDANAELLRISRIDHLTGLANRRSLDEHARRELRRMARERRGRKHTDLVSVLIGDLDHFKLYNDRYGHRAGDACLRAVADAIAGAVHRPGDLACRFGGEEFLVFLPGADREGARVVAESIRRAVRALDLPHETSPTAPMVTLSLGGATRTIADEDFDFGSLIEAADAALYDAKNAGRDRVVVAGLSTPT